MLWRANACRREQALTTPAGHELCPIPAVVHHGAMKRFARLGVGTVQFGQAYGISNARGRVPADDVTAILRRAADAGIGVLDTAANYGKAEAVLGATPDLTRPFRIVTKTIGLKNGLDAVVQRARQSV